MTNPRSLPGPGNVHRQLLPNGLTLLVRENHAAPVVVIQGYISAGSVHDPAGKFGLGSFVAALSAHGTTRRTFEQFNSAIDELGAGFHVGGNSHATSFSARCMSEDLAVILELAADALQRPAFAAERVELVRNQSLVDLDERSQDTDRMAALRFYETMYADHVYGRPISGYTESVAAITQADIREFHGSHYGPAGAVLVVAGAVETADVLAQICEHFGAWHGNAGTRQIPPPAYQPQTSVHVPIAGKAQADIVLGVPTVPRRHPDYFALRVANNILGRFGMMGRIGEHVREQLGLAYYCGSMLDLELEGGVWTVSAGVNPENVTAAIDAIGVELARLADETVPAEELADNQASMTGALPLALETNLGVAATLLEMEWLGLGLDYLTGYSDNVNAIQADDVQHVAAKYLRTDKRVTVVAGP